ncbi:MAG: alpha/beta fold hydrolase [Gemmatimonadota bacterium]|nr:alpha/beta fold hydrolase [Gemmatimonadota bacterium]
MIVLPHAIGTPKTGATPAAESSLDAESQAPIALAFITAAVAVSTVGVLLGLLASRAGAQGAPGPALERGGFAIVRGSDTIVTERFVRGPAALQGSLRIRGAPRQDYFVTLGPGEVVQSFTLSAWMPGAADSAPPAQRIPMTVAGDTVIAQTPAGTRRIPTRFGAVPVLNNSFALIEIFTRRARATGGSGEFPFFATAGGQTLPATVTAVGADSAVFTVAGQANRLAVDAVGRILGGTVGPFRVVRLGPEAAAGMTLAPPPDVKVAPPDYSAPPAAPYTAEDVRVPGPHGITLGGTLTKPKGAGPFPAIVTITGSGQQDRDEFIPLAGGIRLFRQVADTLGRRGIAVLRLDDRGLGASTGDATTSTTADFADDIRAAVAYLRTRKDIDGARIGLLGHSEGGVIAPMVAATDPGVRAIILLAGTASNGLEIIKAQQRYAIDHMPGLTPSQRDSARVAVERQLVVTAGSNPWMHFFIDYDPATTARKVKAPTLIVQGATDRQVPASEAEKLAALIRSGGNTDVTVRVLPNVNHLFLADTSGDFAKYSSLPTNVVGPAVLGVIADWAAQKLGTPGVKP